MIEAGGLSKHYGKTVAVEDLSFTVAPGRVTGFLGPNGAGKSTTMRLVLGLEHPTTGFAHVNGRPYRTLTAPMREVGAALDPAALHKGRTARAHLRWLADAGGIDKRRIARVLEQVGLGDSADRSIGAFSLGMRQRLGLAAALLGDPGVLLLDEPLNGLDPEGIVWVRELLKRLAAEGRTVLLSSHLMNEMEATADHVLVIGRGRLISDVSVQDLVRTGTRVAVRSPRVDELMRLVTSVAKQANYGTPADTTAEITVDGDGLTLTGIEAAEVGDLAARHGIPLHQLTTLRPRLEEVFMDLTREAGDHRGLPLHGIEGESRDRLAQAEQKGKQR